MSKRSITVIDLYKTWGGLRGLEGGRIANIYRVGERTLSFKIRKDGRTAWLVFSTGIGPIVAYGDHPIEGPLQPATALRRYLRGGKLKNVSVINNDRVLRLDVGGYALILEWVREGNIIVLDRDSTILYALFYKKMRDRSIERGAKYRPPPKQGDLFETHNLDSILEKMLASKRRIAAALSVAMSIPGPFIHEALHRLGLDPKRRANEYSPKEVLRLIRETRLIVLESLRTPSGYKVYDADRGEVVDVLPFYPTHMSKYKIEEIDYARGLTDFLLKRMYNSIEESQNIGEGIEREIDKAVNRFENLLAKYRLAIDFLKNNVLLVDNIIADYNKLRAQKTGWKEIEEALKKRYPLISAINHEKKTLYLSIGGEEVEVKLDKSVYKNIEELHDKVKTVRDKLKRAQEKKREKTEKQMYSGPPRREKKWYEDFRFFFTTTNKILVIAGKSAGQNELLVRRYLRPDDIFLHADIHGAPATIMRIEGSAPNEEEILEAAQFAASFSSAWKAGLYSVDVYWVYGKQVSKKAPSGEYLGKGSFMIYGKRNYIRGVKLSLAIGVAEGGEIVVVPELAAEKSLKCYIVLQPGRIDRRLAVRKVRSFLRERCGVDVDAGLIERMLPSGRFYVYREVVKDERRQIF